MSADLFAIDWASPTRAGDRGPVVEFFPSRGDSIAWSERSGQPERSAPYQQADELIRMRADDFVAWLADPDARVRSAAAGALVFFAPRGEDPVRLFMARLTVEPEVECRIALIKAAADFAVHTPKAAKRVGTWLAGIVRDDADPGTRLAAVVHLARSAPEETVDNLTGRAIRLLTEVAAEPRYASRADTWTPDLVQVLHDALAERVADRIALVEAQLRRRDPGLRGEALRLGGRLIDCWRGPFDDLVRLIADQLGASEYPVRHMAALALQDKWDLGAPAADVLAAQVLAAGPDAWNAADRTILDPYRMMLLALARLGDPRAVPGIAAALATGTATSSLVQTLGRFRDHEHELMPGVLGQLASVPDETDPEWQHQAGVALSALRYLGAAEVLPRVTPILEAAIRSANRMVIDSALWTLKEMGPAAQSAMPQVRLLTEYAEPYVALLAIETARAITQDTETFHASLLPYLRGKDLAIAGQAAAAAGAAGPDAAPPLANLIRALAKIRRRDPWPRVHAATALIRMGEGAEGLVPILAAAWQDNAHTRLAIAGHIGALGPQAADFLPLLRAELADPRRHVFRQGVWSNAGVPDDEKLLRLCAEAIERIELVVSPSGDGDGDGDGPRLTTPREQ